jgi:hypothetical protein
VEKMGVFTVTSLKVRLYFGAVERFLSKWSGHSTALNE